MSARAIASARNKRTTQGPNASINKTTSSINNTLNYNSKKELSVQEAFSLMNQRITLLENKYSEISDTPIQQNISTLQKGSDNLSKLESQFKLLQEDFTNITNNVNNSSLESLEIVQKLQSKTIESLQNNVSELKNKTTKNDTINNNTNSNNNNGHFTLLTKKQNELNDKLSELKDIIINVQNFTLELNTKFSNFGSSFAINKSDGEPIDITGDDINNLKNMGFVNNTNNNVEDEEDKQQNDVSNNMLPIDSNESIIIDDNNEEESNNDNNESDESDNDDESDESLSVSNENTVIPGNDDDMINENIVSMIISDISNNETIDISYN
jgi:uncharacterized coiled-coil protein SlyX